MDEKPALDSERTSETVQAKKPYAAPTLVRWGTLREMTLKKGNSGGSDGGFSFNKRRTR